MSCLVGKFDSRDHVDSLKDVYIVIGGPGSKKEYFCRSLASASGVGYCNFSDAEECTCKTDTSRASLSDPTLELQQRAITALRLALLDSPEDRVLMYSAFSHPSIAWLRS